ncbi:c-type cytochrome [Roseisolibacter agri]|uniref:Cytochrome c domain-containing protein n=1 Tax=Roseisolibacter agri TaxID=2014610 RepID=A0AA37VBY9_9BACT|nr:c-type cytochrome [Roseisolibacter agri]GLC27073.1 hypothetical protein rosag_35860 [Roseisolibacter agri]
MARGGSGRGSPARKPARGGRRGGRGGGSRWPVVVTTLLVLAVGGAFAAAWLGLVPGVQLREIAAPKDSLATAGSDAPLVSDSVALADSLTADSTLASADPGDDALPVPAADSAAGDALFRGVGRCAGCHGAAGEGVDGLGPDLRDEAWLHGGTRREIQAVIARGAPAPRGGFTVMMPAYGGQLDATQLAQLTAYVWTLSRPGAVLPDSAPALPLPPP